MPAKDREETGKILDEIEQEQKPEEEKPEAPAKPEADKPKPEEEGKPKPEAGKEEDGKKEPPKPEGRREVKLMPAWLHERSKSDWEKREKELIDALAIAKGQQNGKGDEEKPAPKGEELEQKAAALAEKHGITVELAKDLVELAAQQGKLPADIVEKLKDVDTFREQQAVIAETTQFNADFDAQILPLIKAEYGNEVPQATIDGIRDSLKELAYTPEYAKVPYTTLYKGEDKFRGVIPPLKKGAENSKGGSVGAEDGAKGDELDLTKPLTDEQVKGLSGKDFDTYCQNMEKYEKSLGQAA